MKKINKIFKKGKKSPFKEYGRNEKKSSISIIDLKHDLENQVAKITQQLEGLLLKSETQGSIRRKYEKLCETNIEDVSQCLTFIDRIANQMATEMVCMNILSKNNTEAYESRQEHVIYKTIHRLLMLYEEDFNKRNIRYNISPSTLKWRINNDIFSAILQKIIQNTTKYCLHDTEIFIAINNESINFSMTSLKIYDNEIEKLFQDGYIGISGVKSGKSKTGKGLYHAKQLAEFHKLGLSINAGKTIATGRDGHEYAKNQFIITNQTL